MQVLINPLVISITYPLCESQHKISTVRTHCVIQRNEIKSSVQNGPTEGGSGGTTNHNSNAVTKPKCH